jgi:hypothetical protein
MTNLPCPFCGSKNATPQHSPAMGVTAGRRRGLATFTKAVNNQKQYDRR